MNIARLRNRVAVLLVGIATLSSAGLALADPPTRVARLGYLSGGVSFSPAGENEWVHGVVNRPLVTGDRLWVASKGRAELQIGLAVARLSESTSVTLLNVDDRVTQLELTQGTLNIRVRRLPPNHVVEIDTPNLAFSLSRPGNYRIEVDPAEDSTMVAVRDGAGEVFGEGAAYAITARQSFQYYATGLREYEVVRSQFDDFDRWSAERDRRTERSVALRYVSSDVIGYEDLDANGTWRVVADYGPVWIPTRVASGWAPYRDGHWSWVDPWGWTWIDDAPWGFAVSHYGRWTNLEGTWGWVPGPVRQQAVYAPALVAFVGGSDFRLSISGGNVGAVGWFPLGPRDVYRPSYTVSREYFTRVNTSNTVINSVNITNVYNSPQNVTYINQRVPGAVVAVPTTAFVQSQPVSRMAVRLSSEQVYSAPVTQIAAVAPTQRSVMGPAAAANRPVLESPVRQIIARTAPPPQAISFAARESALAATPGKPLTESEVQRLKPGAPPATPAPQVVVAAPARPSVPMATAQPSQPSAGRPEGRGPSAPGRSRGEPGVPGAEQSGRAQPQPAQQSPATAPLPIGNVPFGQRGRVEPAVVAPQPPAASPAPDTRTPPGQRGRSEQPGTLTPEMAPKPGAPQPSAVAPAEQRPPSVPPGQRGRGEPAPQPPVMTPPAPQPPVAAQPAPHSAAPAPGIVPPDSQSRTPPGQQRGRVEPMPQPAPPPVAQPQPVPPAAVAPPIVRPQPQPVPPPQPVPATVAPPVVRPQPQSVPQPTVLAPTEQRVPPGQRGRAEPVPQPAPPPFAQPQPTPPAAVAPPVGRPQPQPVPQPPATSAPEQRVPPGQRGREPQAQPAPTSIPAPPAARAPEPRPVPPAQAQPNPGAPPPPGTVAPPTKPGAPGADDKGGRDPSKQDEEKRQEEEKKGRRPN